MTKSHRGGEGRLDWQYFNLGEKGKGYLIFLVGHVGIEPPTY